MLHQSENGGFGLQRKASMKGYNKTPGWELVQDEQGPIQPPQKCTAIVTTKSNRQTTK